LALSIVFAHQAPFSAHRSTIGLSSAADLFRSYEFTLICKMIRVDPLNPLNQRSSLSEVGPDLFDRTDFRGRKRPGCNREEGIPKRLMTGVESTELLESASHALAMVKDQRIVGRRVRARQGPTEPRPRDKGEIVKLRERLSFLKGMLART
jgi:hypothetical protein